jgi:hypothetical protein
MPEVALPITQSHAAESANLTKNCLPPRKNLDDFSSIEEPHSQQDAATTLGRAQNQLRVYATWEETAKLAPKLIS